MLYQDTKRFLKQYLRSPSREYVWGFRDNLALLKFLEGRYSTHSLGLNASDIKEAFRDFFEPLCKVIVNFTVEKGVNYKCFDYRVEPKDSKHLEKLIDIIQVNHKYIEYPYENKNDLICLMGKIRRLINAEIYDSQESINKKQLIKYAITKALELDSRDVVFYLKRKYLVKIFDKNGYLASKKNTEAPKQRDESTEKYNGYDEEELESHYYMLFEEYDIDNFIDMVIAELFIQKIDFRNLDSHFFENKALRAIRDIFASELTNYTDANEEYLIGFAGYIFRKHFHEVYKRIASEILQEIANDNKDALEFLKYYSGEVVLIDGIKYKIPSLEKEDGSRWNVQSAIAISNMWIKTKQKMDKYIIAFDDMESKLKPLIEIQKEIEELELKKEDLKKDLIFINQEMEQKKFNTNIIKEYHGGVDDYQKDLQTLKAKANSIEAKIQQMQEMIDDMTIRAKDAIVERKKLELMKRKAQDSINGLEHNLKANNKLYESILYSLAHALTKRKVKV